MDLHALARKELPAPPARILEVGCGKGELSRALADEGYEVVAVDPDAPPGSIFRQTTLEALGDEGPFDGAFASLALHHVDNLAVAVGKLHSLLAQDAPLVVREFGWDLVDEPTARWDYERLGREGGLADWQAEHDGLHGFEAMRSALDAWFRERSFEWGPYLAEYQPGVDDAAEERRLIAAGEIKPIGFVYVGLA
jgi:SAM-dependent methyltransferase